MSHLTDGQLHAHLDGSVEALEGMTPAQIQSHLEACPDCATRLEAAREVHAAAASLLGVAVPSSLSRPPFEEIQRRAASGEGTSAPTRSGPPASRRFAARPQSLAWAASLAVALTAGWLARGMMDTEPVGRVAGRDVMLRESLEAEAGQLGSRESGIGGESADNRNEAYGALEGGVGALGQQEAEEDGLKAASEPLSRNAGPQTAAERKQEDQEDEVAAKAVQEPGDDVRRAADEPRQPAAAMDRLTPQETPEAELARVEEGTERAAADPDERRFRDTADGRAGAGRAAAKIARPDNAATVPQPAGPPDWAPVDRERAEAILGGRILTVDELPILSFHARESDEPPAVWTAQRLASGHTLDLVQRSVAGDAKDTPDVQAPDVQALGARPRDDDEAEGQPNDLLEREVDTEKEAPPGRYESVQLRSVQYLRIHGFLIEARAPLSPDSLRSLLLRLED